MTRGLLRGAYAASASGAAVAFAGGWSVAFCAVGTVAMLIAVVLCTAGHAR